MIYNAPTWANNQAPAINAARLQTLCDAVQADGIEIQTLQQQQANPYTFKGDVTAITDLPSSGNTINDTYYVSTPGALYTWTGSDWEQSSVSASDYAAELTQINNNIGTLSNLTTTDKSSLVNAVNEVDGDVGNLSSLTTTDKSSIVGAVNEIVTDIGDINTALETKAETDGLYEDMTVGNAEQLVSTVTVEDQEPYIFRTAGGSNDIANREYDTLVGGTLVWNQMVRNGNFLSSSGWSAYTGSELSFADGVVTVHKDEGEEVVAGFNLSSLYYLPLVNGHKYLLMATVQTTNGTLSFRPTDNYLDGTTGYAEYSSKTKMAWMWECPSENLAFICRFLGYTGAGVTSPVDFTVENVVFIDLTRVFGATVADYVYGLEQGTPNAGVAWFRKLFPKDYYAYDTGSLQSVQAASHNMVGFNAYDYSTGNAVLLGGVQYQITGAYTSLTYEDINGDAETITPDSSGLFTPTSNGTLTVTGGDGTTTCVHLVWSGYRNGEYEPYKKRIYALDDSLTLRGIPVLDSANNLYYDGDTYESDGTVTRKYGSINMGSMSWTYASNYAYFAASTPTDALKPTRAGDLSTILTAQYLTGNVINSNSAMADVPDKTILYYITSSNFRVFVKNSDYTDATAFTNAMSGVYMQYLLDAPITETAEPFTSSQIVNDFGTEEYVDAGVTATPPTRDVAIPVGHITQYPANLRDKLQHLPELAENDGLYAISQSGTVMTLTEIPETTTDLPDAPTTDGTYSLQATVSGGVATYAWVAAT